MRRFDCSAVLLDLDGVLVDSTALVEGQWRRWAAARGLRPEPFLRICHGRRALETIRLAAPHLDAEAEVAALISEGDSAASADLRALPGARRLVDQLPAGTWAVATSGTHATAAERLRRAGLPAPAVMICAEDVQQGKPHPEVYQRAAMALGASPGECIVIEDSPAGLEAARAAGMIADRSDDHPRGGRAAGGRPLRCLARRCAPGPDRARGQPAPSARAPGHRARAGSGPGQLRAASSTSRVRRARASGVKGLGTKGASGLTSPRSTTSLPG